MTLETLQDPRLRQARWAGWASLVANILIVVTGGAVRLTGSGLGCPTWPRCTEDSFTPHGELGLHGSLDTRDGDAGIGDLEVDLATAGIG